MAAREPAHGHPTPAPRAIPRQGVGRIRRTRRREPADAREEWGHESLVSPQHREQDRRERACHHYPIMDHRSIIVTEWTATARIENRLQGGRIWRSIAQVAAGPPHQFPIQCRPVEIVRARDAWRGCVARRHRAVETRQYPDGSLTGHWEGSEGQDTGHGSERHSDECAGTRAVAESARRVAASAPPVSTPRSARAQRPRQPVRTAVRSKRGIATVRKRPGASGPWHGAASGHGVRLSCSSARETRESADGGDDLAGTCVS